MLYTSDRQNLEEEGRGLGRGGADGVEGRRRRAKSVDEDRRFAVPLARLAGCDAEAAHGCAHPGSLAVAVILTRRLYQTASALSPSGAGRHRGMSSTARWNAYWDTQGMGILAGWRPSQDGEAQHALAAAPLFWGLLPGAQSWESDASHDWGQEEKETDGWSQEGTRGGQKGTGTGGTGGDWRDRRGLEEQESLTSKKPRVLGRSWRRHEVALVGRRSTEAAPRARP